MLVKFAFCFSNDVMEMHFSNVEEHFENDLTSNFFSLSFFFSVSPTKCFGKP